MISFIASAWPFSMSCTIGVLGGFFGGIARRYLDAGIVERHVQPPVLGDRSIDGGGDLRLIGDVAGYANRDATLEGEIELDAFVMASTRT